MHAVGVTGLVLVVVVVVSIALGALSGDPVASGDDHQRVNVGGAAVHDTGLHAPKKCDDNPRAALSNDVLAVDLDVYDRTTDVCWHVVTTVSRQSPTVLTYLLSYTNISTVTQHDVGFRLQLADKLVLVPHTTKIFNDSHPDGWLLDTDFLASSGVTVGSYAPDANAFVEIDVRTPELEGGMNTLRSELLVEPAGQAVLTVGADIIVR